MANINDDLRNYLSKSSKSPAQAAVEDGGFSKGFMNYFSGSWVQGEEQKPTETAPSNGNGWFSEAQKDPCLPSLTKTQRVMGFVGCLLMGTFCFSLASLYIPFLVLKARKFALLYTLGSLFVISSFSLLWGPSNHVKHLLSSERLPFTTSYFGSMFGTVYSAMWLQSTPITVILAIMQVLALIWYIVSYIPGGNTGLKFFSKLFYSACSKTVSKALPV